MKLNVKAMFGRMSMIDPSFAMNMAAGTVPLNNEAKGLFFSAPCPKKMAIAQATAAKQSPKAAKFTAVLPVFGIIDQHDSWELMMLGGTPVDMLNDAFDICMNEDRISNVLFNFHSPGGTSYGVKEMADKIFSARSVKPSCSVANSMMCSAAYYLGSACSRVYASPFADVGSVGVYQMHFDESAAMESEGVKATIIQTPEFKAEGNPYQPLTEAGMDFMKSDVERIYNHFTSDVARYRGVETSEVKASYGKGRSVDASTAAKCGMVNRVATFDDVLKRMQAGTIRPGGGTQSLDDWDGPMMQDVDPGEMRSRFMSARMK